MRSHHHLKPRVTLPKNHKLQRNPLSILYARDASGKFVPLLKGVLYEEINRYLKNRIARTERTKPKSRDFGELEDQGDS